MAGRLGTSRGPVREAARELEGQGLIVSRPRLGSFVADFTATRIADLYEIKIWIERALIEDVIRYWPDEARRSALGAIERIDRSARLAFSRSLFEFRVQIVARIHNRCLAGHVLSLYRKFHIVTALIEAPDEEERMDRILGALRGFWSALAAGDADRARGIVDSDAAHWTRNLAPHFDAGSR